MHISGISHSDNTLPVKGAQSAANAEGEIIIPLGGNGQDNGSKEFKVMFDKDGYPIPDGETLSLKEGASFLFGLVKRNAQYTYKASGNESINDIKAKFHLKDGAIRKCNSYIVDADWMPEKGRPIYFNKEDIDINQ